MVKIQHKKLFWINIYGAQTDAKESIAKIMNEIPELGSEWKGRIQVALFMEPNKKPLAKVNPIKDKQILENSQEELFRYELRVDLHWIENLPEDREYYIKVRWAASEAVTTKKKSKNRIFEIYETKAIQEILPNSSLEVNGIPKLF